MFGFPDLLSFDQGPVSVATVADLRLVPVLNLLPVGTEVFVIANGINYVLRPALGVAVTDNGLTVVATADDASRQWVQEDLFTALQTYTSATIDLAALSAGNVIVPAMPGLSFLWAAFPGLVISDFAGTITTAPTIKAGNNAARDNLIAPGITPTSATLISAAVDAGGNPGGVVPFYAKPAGAVGSLRDLAAALVLDITLAATGVGLTLKGRYFVAGVVRLSADFV